MAAVSASGAGGISIGGAGSDEIGAGGDGGDIEPTEPTDQLAAGGDVADPSSVELADPLVVHLDAFEKERSFLLQRQFKARQVDLFHIGFD